MQDTCTLDSRAKLRFETKCLLSQCEAKVATLDLEMQF